MSKNVKHSDEKIKILAERARTLGIDSFLLVLLAAPLEAVVHKQNLTFSQVVTFALLAVKTMLNDELSCHPEYRDDYKTILSDLLAEMEKAVERANARLKDYQITSAKK